MKIIFSSHAKDRMKQRGIGKSIVLQTICNPDNIDIDPNKGRLFSKRFNSKIMKVSIIEKEGIILVKSVFFKK